MVTCRPVEDGVDTYDLAVSLSCDGEERKMGARGELPRPRRKVEERYMKRGVYREKQRCTPESKRQGGREMQNRLQRPEKRVCRNASRL